MLNRQLVRGVPVSDRKNKNANRPAQIEQVFGVYFVMGRNELTNLVAKLLIPILCYQITSIIFHVSVISWLSIWVPSQNIVLLLYHSLILLCYMYLYNIH